MEQGKKIVYGIGIYLVAKSILNIVLGGFGFTNLTTLILQIGLALVLCKGVRNMNYVTAFIIGLIALYHLPVNLRNLSANWIYLTEGLLDIGAAVLLVFAKDVRAFFETRN